MIHTIKPFLFGALVMFSLCATAFGSALFNGTIQRGESVQDISDMLPPVVREMPVRKAARDDVGRMLGGG